MIDFKFHNKIFIFMKKTDLAENGTERMDTGDSMLSGIAELITRASAQRLTGRVKKSLRRILRMMAVVLMVLCINSCEKVKDPFEKVEDPFEKVEDPIEEIEDPFEEVEDPIEEVEDPFEEVEDPFKEVEDPFEEVEDPFEFENGEVIPGLGDAKGEPTGTKFKLPDGIELTGDITGGGNPYPYWSDIFATLSERKFVHKDGTVENLITPVRTRVGEEEINYRGSGLGVVELLIPLRNTRSTSVEVTIPATTIFLSQSGDCQHGVLIKKVTFTIPANSSYSLNLSLYCGNAHRSPAHIDEIYIWGVVSDSKGLLDLCDRVKNKKINIEEFSRNMEDFNVYFAQIMELQNIVWNVTDYYGRPTAEDISYINSLPNSK